MTVPILKEAPQSCPVVLQQMPACPVVLVLDWDSKLSGGQLCLYHKSSENQSSACGQQVTLVPPAGDTLVIFDSHVEHEVLPSFADR